MQSRHGAPLVKADALSEVALPLASVAPPQVLLITFIGDRRRARRPFRRGQTTRSCKIGSSLALTCTCRGSSTGPSWRSSRHVKVQARDCCRELIQRQLDRAGPGARAARRLVVVTGVRPMIDVSQRGCWIELLLSLEPRSQEARMLCSCLPIQRRHELKHMPVDPA